MEEEGRKQKMMTLMENGYLKVLNGVTTLEEVLKAAQD
jgi:type II secretory ATPase GspE/PulE/Tfp pilus assembly ATPase PilB-like protein